MPIKADIPITWWSYKSFKCHDHTQLIPTANQVSYQGKLLFYICKIVIQFSQIGNTHV